MAHEIGYVTSKEALLEPAAHAAHDPTAAFFANWNAAVDNTARDGDLLCAEMSRLAYADRATVRAALPRAGFAAVDFIGGESLRERLRFRGTEAFLASNPAGVVVLAFRGTESTRIEDLLADADLRQKPWPGSAAHVHAGFLACYLAVRDDVRRLLAPPGAGGGEGGRTVLLTGHSLGGAVATLAAADLEAIGVRVGALVTFGSPLVGDAGLAELLAGVAVRRYVDCCDLIARIPPEKLDREHVRELLAGLTAHRWPRGSFEARVVSRLAAGAGSLFAESQRTADYVHVGTLFYANREGQVSNGARDEERAFDQDEARRGYSPAQGDDAVAFRDLADHAPINYVSALAGRVAERP